MAFRSSYDHKRNLEPIGEPIQVGAWRIAPLLDMIGEKKFLLHTLKSRALPQMLPSVLTFRCDTGPSIAPEACARALYASSEGDRVEFLTEHYELLDPRNEQDEGLRALFDRLIRTLGRFERFRFYASDLFPESIGMNPAGESFLLPNAFVLPFFDVGSGRSMATSLRVELGATSRLHKFEPHLERDPGRIHVSLLAKLIGGIAPPSPRSPARSRSSAFRMRLRETAACISRGEISTLADAYESMFEKPLPSRPRRIAVRPGPDSDSATEACVDEVVNYAAVEGSVTVIKGAPYTGKSAILEKAAALLRRSEAFSVHAMDEWELFARSRRRAAPKGKGGTHGVWIIDDIDEKALAYSEFSTAMLDSPSFPRGSTIFTLGSDGATREVEEFLTRLRAQRPDRFHEIVTDDLGGGGESNRLASTIGSALQDMAPEIEIEGQKPPKLVQTFLGALRPEERQLLEFIAVARFAVPLDLVFSVFSESSEQIGSSILRLTELNAIEIIYRAVPTRNIISLVLRIESTALRRLIYDAIPTARRKRLHRTVALVAEQLGFFPKYMLLFHSLQAKETELAARHAVSYVRETDSGKRHPYIVSLCVDLLSREFLGSLTFRHQILAYHELSVELLRAGKTSRAEALLCDAQELIAATDAEDKLKNAARLSAIYRLLAERWEERGEFRRAYDLLEEARESLQSALPIPDQAQLLNDVGWLEYRLGNYDDSMESCRLSLNTLNANQYPSIVAQALNLMGVVHFNTSRYDEAISYYEQSAYLRERVGDDSALSASFNNLALAYQSKGEYEKALEYYDKSLDLKKRQSNRAGIAAGYLNLALLHLEARNIKEADAKCRESLAIAEELGNAQLAADNYITLGDIALGNGDFSTAEHHYQESMRISHQRETINEEMRALRHLSSLCLERGRLEEAEEHAEAALKLVRRIGSRYEKAQIEVVLGDLELRRNRPTEALKHYEKAGAEYTALSKHRMAATILSKIGLIHSGTGNNFDARQYLDRAQDFVRSDIGRELPEEFLKLQHALRARPTRTSMVGDESQKLLLAFYDLSALTDHAPDRHEFFYKIMDVIKQIVDPTDCYLSLCTERDRFVVFDITGKQNPAPPPGGDAFFRQTLLRGSLLDTQSADAAAVVADLRLPEITEAICIPLKAMSEEIGCLLFYVPKERLPLSKEDINFFTSLGRQIAANLKLMLHLNEDFLRDEILEKPVDEGHVAPINRTPFKALIGKSESMKKIFRMLERVTETDSGILILGESGTGKSAFARAIHESSPRGNRPFQEIHCAQIPHDLLESELFGHERGSFTGAVQRKPGLCEVANGGTLFLDDINVMPVETQTKLLHFIENKSYMRLGGTKRLTADVRIIAASNEVLETLCQEGRFREDLYYRLKVILIDLPPLRERKDDIVAIALAYLKRSCAEKDIPLKTLSPEAVQLLQKAPWRGNVRELQNVLERVVVLSDETIITPGALPDDFLKEVVGTSRETHQRLDDLVERIIELGSYSEATPLLPALEAMLARNMVDHVENKTRAAALLGISKPTLYARLREYDKMH